MQSLEEDIQYRAFKPRHSFSMKCQVCGWSFRGGGYETLKQARDVESDQRDIHHKTHHRSKNLKKALKYIVTLHRNYHAAEIPHNHIENAVTNASRPTTTSSTYSDVSNTTMTSASFTAGQKYFIFVTAAMDIGDTTAVGFLRMLHGSTPFDDSEGAAELTTAGRRVAYKWWTVWTAVSGEGIKMQFKNSNNTTAVGVNLVTISIMRLTPDLPEGTYWWHDVIGTNTSLTENTDSATNNASINVVAATANRLMLIFSKARYGPGLNGSYAVNSRINRAGGGVSSLPEAQQNGEDGTNDMPIHVLVRTDTLANTNVNTYSEISKAMNTGATATRTHSGMFAIDLHMFKDRATAHNEEPVEQIIDASATSSYGDNVQSIASYTPTVTGDHWMVAAVSYDFGGGGSTGRIRYQVANSDAPPNITSNAYDYDQWASTDKVPLLYNTIKALTASTSYILDVDGSVDTVASANGVWLRHITAFSMEMAVGKVLVAKNETVGITENIVVVKRSHHKQAKNETVGITENVVVKVTNVSGIISQTNFQLRLSGGSTNNDPLASRGGAKSSNSVSMTLLDDVLRTEASAGRREYRCLYLHNGHDTITATNVKVFIPTGGNTPAPDVIRIGLGTSAINGTEQDLTGQPETTAPSGVTFSLADGEENALVITDPIPPGQHKAIWFERDVPPGTPQHLDNTHSLSVSVFSDNNNS